MPVDELKEDGPVRITIHDNYEGKRNIGRATIYEKPDVIVNHILNSLKAMGFEIHYISEWALTADRMFSFERIFQKTGSIELTFFRYADHVVCHYVISSQLGLSVVTISILVIHSFLLVIWLDFERGLWSIAGAFSVWLILMGVLIYQKVTYFKFFKNLINSVIRKL